MTVLGELLEGLEYEVVQGGLDRQVRHLVHDSRAVGPDDVFVAIRGTTFDAHDALPEVGERGAAAAVIERDVEIPASLADATVVRVADARHALALMSAAYFGHPAREMFVVGVTGTKGKTTVTTVMREVLEACGVPCGLIGTNGIFVGSERVPTDITTPESYDIHRALRHMADAGCKAAVMEVSSQALKMRRTDGILFDVGVFTNLGRDHLGGNEHASMEEYVACKGRLFRQCRVGVVNADSDYLDQLLEGHTCALETFGIHHPADYEAHDIVLNDDIEHVLTRFRVTGRVQMDVEITMPGEFSVSNALAVIATLSRLGLDPGRERAALRAAQVPGRMELMEVGNGARIVFDFAHNAISLRNILTTLRSFHPKRLIAMFGLDGDRTKVRRYEMGQISGQLADLTVLTSTIPRSERPEDIIAEIAKGTTDVGGRYIAIPKRHDAIVWMVDHARPGDVIMLVGHVDDRPETLAAIRDRVPATDDADLWGSGFIDLGGRGQGR